MHDRRESTLRRLAPYIERARHFSGWDFAQLDVRPVESEPPWDYTALAADRAKGAARVLDVGTGGGEVYERIIGAFRTGCVATERWHVNAPVARDRLRPLGRRRRARTQPITPIP